MRLFGQEIRSKTTKDDTVYTFEDEELAKLLGFDLKGMSNKASSEATFYTSLRILSDNVSKLPLKLHQSTKEGTQKSDDHYLYNLLKLRPNAHMSSSVFWKTVEYQRNYYGHSVVVIDSHERGKHAGRVKQLIPLDMNKVEMWIDDLGLLGDKANAIYFIYTDKKGREYKYKQSEVLHFMGGMTADGITPMPVKKYLKTLIQNAQASQEYTNNYLKNGLHAKGIIKYVGDLSEEGQKKLQDRMSRISGGIDKSGQVMPLPVGMDYQNITSSMADAQFTELQQLTIKQIASAFGIKPHQLGDLERSTNSNIEHQTKEFYVDTLQPILTAYEQELTYKLLTSKEVNQGYFLRFNVDAILRSQSKERAEYLKTLVSGGIMTSNEARALIDLPNADYADELMINGSYLPLHMAAKGLNYSESLKGGDNDD